MDLSAPYLPYAKLREIAADFLAHHHSDGTIPVPIEHIIEFDYELDIVPIPGLKDQFDVDAYIANDLTEIRVDQRIQERSPNRYRFSLAHELSHFIIHDGIFKALKFSTISEWKTMIQTIPADVYKWIEIQAYGLAGLILVPPQPLKDVFNDVKAKAAKAGIEIADLGGRELDPVLSHIGKQFAVSSEVITKRLEKDNLLSR